MSEHIKTGKENLNIRTSEQIHIAVGAFDKLFPLDAKTYRDEKWVSLSWLKEQLKNRTLCEQDTEDFNRGVVWGYAVILSLLEEP